MQSEIIDNLKDKIELSILKKIIEEQDTVVQHNKPYEDNSHSV